jgi:DNA invertase Pin-like site-specific DNA recombinase
MTLAFSYVRWSSKQQEAGDSKRRQTEAAEAYCKRRGWELDATLNLCDQGVSAYRGKNALFGNLGLFLREVKRGTVRPGSALIVESLDRISRQGIDEGYDIIKGILKAGVLLVTLSPEREFDASATKSLSRGALEIQLILERAAEESERKSERVGAAWSAKKAAARSTKKPLTRILPGWVEERGGALHLIPGRAAAVRRIFELSLSGRGALLIAQKLTAEGFEPWGPTGKWNKAYICKIMGDGRVTGAFQPRDRHDRPDGPAIADYFPPVIDQATWDACRGLVAQRKKKHGRPGKSGRVNLWQGLLRDARTGGPYFALGRLEGRGREGRRKSIHYVLTNRAGDQGHGATVTFPADVFDRAVLSLLREVDPRSILPLANGHDLVVDLEAQLAGVEAELAAADTLLHEKGLKASPTIGQYILDLEARKAELARLLADARQKAREPLSAAWGEFKSLADMLDAAPDPQDARLRLRSVLRRVVAEVWLLIAPRGHTRLCACQIFFAADGGPVRREYLVLSRQTKSNGTVRTEGDWLACSLPDAGDLGDLGGLDLRDRKHAARAEAGLLKLDLQWLAARMGGGA